MKFLICVKLYIPCECIELNSKSSFYYNAYLACWNLPRLCEICFHWSTKFSHSTILLNLLSSFNLSLVSCNVSYLLPRYTHYIDFFWCIHRTGGIHILMLHITGCGTLLYMTGCLHTFTRIACWYLAMIRRHWLLSWFLFCLPLLTSTF